MNKLNKDGRDFSVELESSKYITRVAANGSVLIEGTLGKLQHASFVEPEILEVKGDFGVLRLNVWINEITAKGHQE
jgi:hypothetical protein